MAKRRNSGASGRGTLGLLIAAVGILCWFSDQRRVAVFIALAIFVPYLAFIAPLKCGGYRARDGMPCGNIGLGLLIGCHWHRFDRIRRIFRAERRPRASVNRPPAGYATARSGGIPRRASAAGEPTRLRTFDLVSLAIAALGTVAGWLALVINPGGQ